MLIIDKLAEEHYHHDSGGKVVEDSRHEECAECNDPEERTLVAGGDTVSDDTETSVNIHKLHDSHGSDKEEQSLRNVAEMLYDIYIKDVLKSLMAYRFARKFGVLGKEFLKMLSGRGMLVPNLVKKWTLSIENPPLIEGYDLDRKLSEARGEGCLLFTRGKEPFFSEKIKIDENSGRAIY